MTGLIHKLDMYTLFMIYIIHTDTLVLLLLLLLKQQSTDLDIHITNYFYFAHCIVCL